MTSTAAVAAAVVLLLLAAATRVLVKDIRGLRGRVNHLEEQHRMDRDLAAAGIPPPPPPPGDSRRFEQQALRLVATLQETTHELDQFLAGLRAGVDTEGGHRP